MVDFAQQSFSKIPLITSFLAEGDCIIGEILLRPDFSLRHQADRLLLEKELTSYDVPKEARQIARYDDHGVFRPLKTAPNLRRGWLLQLEDMEQMLLALDFFYPTMLDLYGELLQSKLATTPLRETLDRQTGMYRITQSLTNEQAQGLIAKTCCSDHGCLRKVLWSIAPGEEITTLSQEKKSLTASGGEIPLLCREACNLLVAAARHVVKKNGVSPIIH